MRRWLTIVFLVLAIATPTLSFATTYYVGPFTTCNAGPCPTMSDDSTCGTAHPCATLAYWNQKRRSVLAGGDSVRLTGAFVNCATGGCNNQCILPRSAVTYEGRTATDQPVNNAGCGPTGCIHGITVVDTTNETNASPCFNRGLDASGPIDITGFTIRDIDWNIPSGKSGLNFRSDTSSLVSTNVKASRLKVTGPPSSEAIYWGSVQSGDPPCATGRTLAQSVLEDSEIANTGGNNGGVWIGCVDGLTLQRNYVHDNALAVGDGLHFGGAINFTVSDNFVTNIGADCFDFSGNNTPPQCEAGVHNGTVERNQTGTCGNSGMSFDHCNHDILVRNNFLLGHEQCLLLKTCPHDLQIYNNTCWSVTGGRGINIVSMVTNVDIENNIVRSLQQSNLPSAVSWVPGAWNPSNTIAGNNLIEPVGGNVFTFNSDVSAACKQDNTRGITCPCNAPDLCDNYSGYPCTATRPCAWCKGGANHRQRCCIRGSGCDPGWLTTCAGGGVCTGVDPSTPVGSTYNSYALFQADCTGTAKLTPSGCTGDIWHTVPLLVNAANPTVANLHLSATDTVCRGHGVTLASVPQDYDRQNRSGEYDIGADQVNGSTALSPPQLLSVEPVP